MPLIGHGTGINCLSVGTDLTQLGSTIYGFNLEFGSCYWCNLEEDKAVLRPHHKEKKEKAQAPGTPLLGYNDSEPRLVHKRNRWWVKNGQSIRNTKEKAFLLLTENYIDSLKQF